MYSTTTRLVKKIMYIIIPAVLVLLIAVGIYYYFQARSVKISALSERVKTIAATGAMQIDGILFEQIRSPEDYNSQAYTDIQNSLVQIQTLNNLKANEVKTLRREGNITLFIASAQRRNIIGREFGLMLEMNPVFNQSRITVKQPYEMNGYEVMSAFAPIKAGDNVAGILQVDLNIEGKLPSVFNYLQWPIIAGLLFLGFFLIGLRRILAPLQEETDNIAVHLQKIADGDMTSKLSIHDETYLYEIIEILEKLQSGLQKQAENIESKEKVQKQIKSLLGIVSAAAEGDFTVKAHVSADTLGALSDSFNLMVADLSSLVRDVKKGAEHVGDFTMVILQTTKKMADGARNQAREIGNINKLAKEMALIANNTNDSAQRAAVSANFAKEVAQKGGEIVKKSIEAMHRIGETVLDTSKRVSYLGELSDRIEQITEFISDISNRTNLLALNASIEAVRAGAAGRGFTIVADEVRNLAEHSSRAAGEINYLIEDIQNGMSEAVMAMDLGNREVEESTQMVDEAGVSLREILGAVDTSARSASEITDATQKQLKSSQDIVRIMEDIAKIAEQTAEGAKKSEIEIARLETLSKSLNEAITKFKLTQ
jgi:methyl-accepting chemotaxis protein